MNDFLTQIIQKKKENLQKQKETVDLSILQKRVESKLNSRASQTLNFFYQYLNRKEKTNIIAEIKRISPSKGSLRPELNPKKIALAYEKSGAQAISVLTEENFFGGSPRDLELVKQTVKLPVLRKDFIFEEYQVWESALLGANAILLIVAILQPVQIKNLSKLARELKLNILLEVHNEEELKIALESNPQIIGVNNRNLHTFAVDPRVSLALIDKFQKQTSALWVSESGLNSYKQIKELQNIGFKAFLIGETLLTAKDPIFKLKELIGCLTDMKNESA